jgi:cytochrome c
MKIVLLAITLVCVSAPCLALDTRMPPDAEALGCINCHAIDRKVVGPAWIEVSKRYRDKREDKAFIATLVKKVSRGGFGNWGKVPMVANDPAGTHQDKIHGLVKFVLSLSDQLPQHSAQR